MDTQTMDMLFGILGIACGGYCIYSYINMKRTHVIDARILLSRDMKASRCKDTDAFLKAVLPQVLVLGITALLYGILELAGMMFDISIYVVMGCLGLFMLVIIWNAVSLSKATKKYFPKY